MILWIDAQLSPALAPWLSESFQEIEAYSARWLGLRDAADQEIWDAARAAGAAVMTKDQDFVQLLTIHGPPPQLIWVTCGNTSNARMRTILAQTLPEALILLAAGEPLIEIRDLPEGQQGES